MLHVEEQVHGHWESSRLNLLGLQRTLSQSFICTNSESHNTFLEGDCCEDEERRWSWMNLLTQISRVGLRAQASPCGIRHSLHFFLSFCHIDIVLIQHVDLIVSHESFDDTSHNVDENKCNTYRLCIL